MQRILGLTASPGSETKKIKEICDNLKIEAVETRTRESEDVKPYLQKLTFEAIKVEFPQELKDVRVLLKIIYDKKIKELQSRKLIFRMVTKITLLDLQKKLRNMVISGNHHFNVLRGISICAQAIKLQYALELLETQTVETFFNYMKDLYEQARNKKSKAVVQIVNSREFQDAYIISIKLYETGFEHPKIQKLKEIVEEEIKQNKNSKLLIFSQYRDSVYKINSELGKIGLKTAIFIGQAKKKDMGLSQKEQQLTLWKFKQGEINCLISTSIGEEGLDIPEVNAVIFYEPVPSAIRKIQRAGRTARLKPGKLIILITKDTRDESHYWASHHKEKKMHQAIEEIKNGLDTKKEHKTLLDFKP
jgi:Fanconi anemia group M protein